MTDFTYRIAQRFLRGSKKKEFLDRLFEELSDDNSLEGLLDEENAVLRRFQSDPYVSISEFREYDPEGFSKKLRRLRDALEFKLGRIQFGSKGVLVYRALSLKDPQVFVADLVSKTLSIGKYWTFDKGRAIPYWGNSRQSTCILSGELPTDSVDYLEMVRANTTRAFSANEDEVTAKPGFPVYILEASVEGQVVKIHRSHKI